MCRIIVRGVHMSRVPSLELAALALVIGAGAVLLVGGTVYAQADTRRRR